MVSVFSELLKIDGVDVMFVSMLLNAKTLMSVIAIVTAVLDSDPSMLLIAPLQ